MATKTWPNKSLDEVFKQLKSGREGLTEKKAASRLAKYGYNKLPEAKMDSLAVIFIRQFKSPFIYVLLAASLIIFFLQEITDSLIILFVLFLNAIIGAFQEGKAQNTLAALKNFITTNATVLRDGRTDIIPDTNLVIGDVILLAEGEKIPADARIVSVNMLKIDEAVLTGESRPVEKTPDIINSENLQTADQKNMVFRGTNISTGNGVAIITATGLETVIGKISKSIESIDKEIPLKDNLNYLSRIVIYAIGAISIFLFALGMLAGKGFTEMLATVISMAVSVIPEGLPIVMTMVLAIGVSRMSKKNILVKKLQAVETLGQVNIIAVDKTGTLTKNEMVIERVYMNGKIYDILGNGYEPSGNIMADGQRILKPETHEIIFAAKIAAFCSNAHLTFIEKTQDWHIAGDPTEAAMLVFAEKCGLKKEALLRANPSILDIPFDYNKKYHAVINQAGRKKIISVTGAPEAILSLVNLKKEEREEQERIFQKFSSQGSRVIGFAYKEINDEDSFEISDLNFGGFFCMKDALREQVRGAVKRALAAGVKVVMITGDHKITAKAIALDANIFKEGDEIMTGEELDKMDDDELAYKIKRVTIFARVNPEHKLRIIKAFKKNGNVVAMTGDGVNDAPSLVAADVGVAMGKIGTEVAKEASDIILLDDNFGNIISGLKEGRNMYHAIKRVILYLFSTNTGEVLTLVVSVILGLPLPLLAAQIIWLNLISDSFIDVALSLEPKDKNIANEKFVKPSKHIINSLMALRMALMSITMMIGTLYVFSKYLPNEGSAGDLRLAWTMALTTITVFHWFNAFNCRSEIQSVFTSNPFSNRFLIGALLIVVTLQMLAIYYQPMQDILRTAPLGWNEWKMILLIASSIIIIEEIRKFIFRKRALNLTAIAD